MSHITRVDYQQIEIKCNSICELALDKVSDFDKLCEQLTSTSTTLLNNVVEDLLKDITEEKEKLVNQIKKVQDLAKENAKKGVVSIDSDRSYYVPDVIAEANKLHDQINNLTSSKLLEYNALLNKLLKEHIEKINNKLYQNGGEVSYSNEFIKLLDTIEDSVLKHYVTLAYLDNSLLSNNELINKAKEMMNESNEERLRKEKQLIIEELEKQRANYKAIDKIKNINTGNSINDIKQINEVANKEIIDEKVRKKSLSFIKKAIEARGFIVDKKNIKIDKEKNEVLMVALKPSGEKAQFKVYLDGKFIYDFHGYEGQACQKDIEPFIKDLEEVYGMKIVSTEDIWSNPDKISSMKYQQMNYNKNKG